MKMKKFVFELIILACVYYTACHNSIMEKWWYGNSTEVEPIPIVPVSSIYHVVRFEDNGGEPVPGDQLIADNGKISKIPAMSRKNADGYPYGFGGWFREPGLANEWHFAEDTVTADIMLYAKWVEPKYHPAHPDYQNPPPSPAEIFYTVDFQMNGGNAGGGTLDPLHILEGVKIPEPPALRRAVSRGSEIWMGFGGWYTDLNFNGEPWNFATRAVSGVDADSNGVITLFAKWVDPPVQPTQPITPNPPDPPDPPNPPDPPVPSHILVTFETEGGTPEPRLQDLIDGTRIVEPYAMSRIGYGFGGWYTDVTFIKQWDFAVDVVSAETPEIILYARWVTNFYNVTFFPNGGSPAPRSQSVAHGTMVASPPIMRNPGMGLIGWYTDEACSDGSEWDFNTTVTGGDINLYAKWDTAHYIARFDLKLPQSDWQTFILPPPSESGHGNLAPSDQEIIYGGKVTEPPPASIAGLSFVGWYYSEDYTVDPTTVHDPAKRDALKEWDFNTSVTDDYVNDEMILYIYARWVPLNPNMIWVQKGSFTMGGGTGASPAHGVKLTEGFYIGKYPVTQQEYIDTTTGEPGANPDPSQFQADQRARPVERVSWYDAIQYCIRLTDQENTAVPGLNLTQFYTLNNITRPSPAPATSVTGSIGSADVTVNWNGTGYRLPTEAEWEYSARGGNGSPGSFIFAGSDTVDDVAWYNLNSLSMTHPVGGKAPNGLGIYDMNGNVSEWCWDWHDSKYYSASGNNIDPRGPLNGTERVRRGGNWNNALNNVRNVVRSSADPANANWVIGFRVVRDHGVTEIY